MIRIRNLNKVFHLGASKKVVASNINMNFPTKESVGLLGRNGADRKSVV